MTRICLTCHFSHLTMFSSCTLKLETYLCSWSCYLLSCPLLFLLRGKNVFSVILWTNTPLFKQHKETKSWKCVFCPTFASEHMRVCISVSTVFVWLISVTGVCAQRRVSYPFHSLDLISNSPYFLLYNSYHVGSENLVMGRLVILLLIFLFILVTCLLDIVFIF